MDVNKIELNGESIVLVETDVDSYRLQLPDCPDSMHTDSNGNDIEGDVLAEMIEAVKKIYTENRAAHFFTGWGNIKVIETELEYEGYAGSTTLIDVYIVINQDGDEEYQVLVESNYSDYYNVFLLGNIQQECSLSEKGEVNLNDILKAEW